MKQYFVVNEEGDCFRTDDTDEALNCVRNGGYLVLEFDTLVPAVRALNDDGTSSEINKLDLDIVPFDADAQ